MSRRTSIVSHVQCMDCHAYTVSAHCRICGGTLCEQCSGWPHPTYKGRSPGVCMCLKCRKANADGNKHQEEQ